MSEQEAVNLIVEVQTRVDERARRVRHHIVLQGTPPPNYKEFDGTKLVYRARTEDSPIEESIFQFPIDATSFEDAFQKFDEAFKKHFAEGIVQAKETVLKLEEEYAKLMPEKQKEMESQRVRVPFFADLENRLFCDSSGRQIRVRVEVQPTKLKYVPFEGQRPYKYPIPGTPHMREEMLTFAIEANDILDAFKNYDLAYEAAAKKHSEEIAKIQAAQIDSAYQRVIQQDVHALREHKKDAGKRKLILPPHRRK